MRQHRGSGRRIDKKVLSTTVSKEKAVLKRGDSFEDYQTYKCSLGMPTTKLFDAPKQHIANTTSEVSFTPPDFLNHCGATELLDDEGCEITDRFNETDEHRRAQLHTLPNNCRYSSTTDQQAESQKMADIFDCLEFLRLYRQVLARYVAHKSISSPAEILVCETLETPYRSIPQSLDRLSVVKADVHAPIEAFRQAEEMVQNISHVLTDLVMTLLSLPMCFLPEMKTRSAIRRVINKYASSHISNIDAQENRMQCCFLRNKTESSGLTFRNQSVTQSTSDRDITKVICWLVIPQESLMCKHSDEKSGKANNNAICNTLSEQDIVSIPINSLSIAVSFARSQSDFTRLTDLDLELILRKSTNVEESSSASGISNEHMNSIGTCNPGGHMFSKCPLPDMWGNALISISEIEAKMKPSAPSADQIG